MMTWLRTFLRDFRATGAQIGAARVGCSTCDNDTPTALFRHLDSMVGEYPAYVLICRSCYFDVMREVSA